MAASAESFRAVIEAGLRGESDLAETLPTINPDGLANESLRYQAIESAFRAVLKERIIAADVNPVELTSVIDAAIALAQAKQCTPTTPHTLLDDVFDMSVLDVCEQVFTFVESRLDAWSKEPFSGVGPRNVMLRLCNALSARLSSTRDTVLSGRILLFLASVTPLSDKSGINMGSQFNSANVTTYDEEADVIEENEAAAAAESASAALKAAEDDKPDDSPVDFTFYRQFWTLQKYFTTPTLCFTKSGWSELLRSLKAVMQWFTVNKLDAAPERADAAASRGATAGPAEDSEMPYFPKFLTSSKLFHLELADAGFRRQILVQLLVLFQYLTGTVKFKKDTQKLSKLQNDTIAKMQAAVYILLKNTPPHGDKFAESARTVLASEQVWVTWKNEGCPDFFRDSAELRKRKAPDDEEEESGKKARVDACDMGSAELTRLWNLSKTNLEGCESAVESGRSIPDVETYFAEAIQQVSQGIDKRFWVFTEPAYIWRALRLLGKDRLHYFQEFNQGKTLEDYMELVVKKLAAEDKKVAEPAPMQE